MNQTFQEAAVRRPCSPAAVTSRVEGEGMGPLPAWKCPLRLPRAALRGHIAARTSVELHQQPSKVLACRSCLWPSDGVPAPIIRVLKQRLQSQGAPSMSPDPPS